MECENKQTKVFLNLAFLFVRI